MDNLLLNTRGEERHYLRSLAFDYEARSQAMKDISKETKLRFEYYDYGTYKVVDSYDVSTKYLPMSPKRFKQYIIIENEKYG